MRQTAATGARLTPASLEAHDACPLPPAAVTALLATLGADPAWTVTAWTVGGRLVQVELLYHPSGEAFTLRPPRRAQEQSVGAGP